MTFHDIGLKMVKNDAGEIGFAVIVGGGMGRTPMIGPTIRDFLPKQHLLSYLEAVLRVYNLLGRRDNLYKARIKILVSATGAQEFGAWSKKNGLRIKDGVLDPAGTKKSRASERYFQPPAYEKLPAISPELEAAKLGDAGFARWVKANTHAHKVDGYSIVTISLKPVGGAPGDASADQMDLMADLADEYSIEGAARHASPEPGAAECAQAGSPCDLLAAPGGGAAGEPECRLPHRHHRLPGPGLLQPRQCAVDPDRPAPVAALQRLPAAGGDRRAAPRTSPAVSMPAGITTQAISASSASISRAKSSTRSPSADRRKDDSSIGKIIGPGLLDRPGGGCRREHRERLFGETDEQGRAVPGYFPPRRHRSVQGEALWQFSSTAPCSRMIG